MRLIRTVLQPANIGLSRQFQRSQLIKTCSSDLLHPGKVLIGTSNLDQGSNIRRYSVSASSEAHETKKPRGRVSKDVRKSMVEKFVNKYRETNAGKFPSASEAMKDVGGSYYVIREILQELIYNSKMSPPVDTKTASSDKSAIIEKDEISTINTEKDSQATEMEELIISPITEVNVQDSSVASFESNQDPQPPISVESGESKEVGNQSCHPTDQPKGELHLDPENDKTCHEDEQKCDEKIVHENKQIVDTKTAHEDEQKFSEKFVHENEQKLDGSQSKAELQESTEVSGRELHKATTEDVDDKTKTSVWQNLKSFANGIMDMWKRY
ncbi:hypothetical protein CASFOL_021266 [Castilleja foliolosa]|uniref:AT3G52170-like helix-turn-helix domain-containing protein n=1 Tax=Castilleja foliolosa TaxID=1961234 RepID=A0ABD3CX09_9LAMI